MDVLRAEIERKRKLLEEKNLVVRTTFIGSFYPNKIHISHLFNRTEWQ